MAEKGQVIQLKDHFAVVSMTRKEACAKCRACVAGFSEKQMLIEAENECGAKVGDWVEVTLADDGFFGAVLIMYGIPMIGLIAGFLLGYYALWPLVPTLSRELVSFGLGILFVVVIFFWIRSQESRWESKKYRPSASKITEPPEEGEEEE